MSDTQRPRGRILGFMRDRNADGSSMGRADPGYDTTPPNADALNRRTQRARVDDLMETLPRTRPNAAAERAAAAPRRRPAGRSRELSADELNSMVLSRLGVAGYEAPAEESTTAAAARRRINNAMPAFKKGGAVKSKAKPAAYKKGGSVKSAKRK